MKRLIIVGSPRTRGRSAHLAEMLFEANIDEYPEDELFLVPVSEVQVGPCIGCNACRRKTGVTYKCDDGNEVTVQKHRCVFDDDMQALYDLIDDVGEVTVVSPVYFSGAPAPMKCVLDRLQPYFWARVDVRESGAPLPEKRPLTLHVLGEGGDPHGYDALVSEVRSAFATADFRLERVLDWVGKIDESGEITAEATEKILFKAEDGESAGFVADARPAASDDEAGAVPELESAGGAEKGGRPQDQPKPRPKLNLHSGIQDNLEDARGKKTLGKSRPASKGSGGVAGGPQSRSGGKSKASGGSSARTKKQGRRRGR